LNKKIEFVQSQLQDEMHQATAQVMSEVSEAEKRLGMQINEANDVMKKQGNDITKSIGDKERGLNETI
jgi:hypothetical protein